MVMAVIESSPILKPNVTAVFQQLEVDYIIGRPNKDVHVTDLTDVPIIRMYGVTESGTRNIVRACTNLTRYSYRMLPYLQVVSHTAQLMHHCRKQCLCVCPRI